MGCGCCNRPRQSCTSIDALAFTTTGDGELLINQDGFKKIDSCDLVSWTIENCQSVIDAIGSVSGDPSDSIKDCQDIADCINSNAAVQAAITALIPAGGSFTCADVATCIGTNAVVQNALTNWLESGSFTLTGDWDFDGNVDLTGAIVDLTGATVTGLPTGGSGLPGSYVPPATPPPGTGTQISATGLSSISVIAPCDGFAIVCGRALADNPGSSTLRTTKVTLNGIDLFTASAAIANAPQYASFESQGGCTYVPVVSGQALNLSVSDTGSGNGGFAEARIDSFICGA